MSIVAWDGKTLAADRQGTHYGLRRTIPKSKRLPNGDIVAWTGEAAQGLILSDWHVDGADPEKWPKFQETDDWCRLIVITKQGVIEYEQYPAPMRFEGAYMAWGAGRDFALGALAMGATAKEAVEVACRFNNSCGMGVDVYELTSEA